MTDEPREPRPADLLTDVRVLDAGSFIAAPLAAMTLGDWGADVIKLEPLEGDAARHVGPQAGAGFSATFMSANRGKRSVALDLRSPDARTAVDRLVDWADIVVHNLAPAAARRIGLGASGILERSPATVVATVSAYGEIGPAAGRPALDPVVQAMSGLASATGPPDGEPYRCAAPVVDTATGLATAAAALAALHRCRATGQGGYVSVSLLDVALAMQAPVFALRSLLGETPPRRGNGSFAVLGDQLAARDGLLAFVVWDDPRWAALCHVLELDDLVDDPRYAGNDARCEWQDELRPRLATAFAAWGVAELESALLAAGIPCARTQDLDAVAEDPQVRAARSLYVETGHEHPGVTLPAPTARIDGLRSAIGGRAPAVGEHTDEVLLELVAVRGSSGAGKRVPR